MVEKTNYILIEPKDDGSISWKPIMNAFEQIQDKINFNADEAKAIAQHQTFTISYAVEAVGTTTILNSSKHPRAKIINAFVQVGDNLPLENIVEIEGITNTIKISDTHTAGNMRLFKILKPQLHFIDNVKVKTTSDRRIIVNLTLESIEEA